MSDAGSPKAASPMTTRSRAPTSMHVSTALARTDSAIPRALIRAMTSMNAIATGITLMSTNAESASPPNPRASVLAEVMPDAMTAKAIMKVRKGMSKALLT